MTLTKLDAEGVRHVVNNLDFEAFPTQAYRRSIIRRIRELLDRDV